ncbi:MAG: histidine phosphatase family protein [Motiliproteus sp.]
MSDTNTLKSMATRLDLLRHGACSDGGIYRGRTDSELSAIGQAQMAESVIEGYWDRIYSSPLSRCRVFATELSERLQLPLIVDERLIELDFGDWEGCSVDQVWQQQQQAVLEFWQDPAENPPPGGETLGRMKERTVQLLHDVHRNHHGDKVLLVCHGGVIRMLLSYLLQMPLQAMCQLSVSYGSLSRIELYQNSDGGEFGSEVIFTNRLPEHYDYDLEHDHAG